MKGLRIEIKSDSLSEEIAAQWIDWQEKQTFDKIDFSDT
jgi:hypothetical protein